MSGGKKDRGKTPVVRVPVARCHAVRCPAFSVEICLANIYFSETQIYSFILLKLSYFILIVLCYSFMRYAAKLVLFCVFGFE